MKQNGYKLSGILMALAAAIFIGLGVAKSYIYLLPAALFLLAAIAFYIKDRQSAKK